MVSRLEGGHGFQKLSLYLDGSPLINLSLFCHKGESLGRSLRNRVGAGASADVVGAWGWSA